MLRDLALVYGGSVVVGAGIGGAVGFLGFGVGAIPGAAAGASVGAEVGTWLLTVLGLASLLKYVGDALPKAFVAYKEGFRLAWGPDNNLQRDQNQRLFGINFAVARAAAQFAEGHVIVLLALLAAIVAYLLRGKGEKVDNGELLSQIRKSPKLGPDVARWVEQNEAQLLKEPALRPRVKPETGGGRESVKPNQTPAPRRAGPSRPSQDPPPPSKASAPSFLKPRGTGSTLEPGAVPGDWAPKINAMPDVPSGFSEIPQNAVNTFTETPNATTLPEGTTLYRIVGDDSNPAGSFWTRDMPASEAEWRADAAVKGVWNGNGGYVQYTVPEGGMPAWTGTAAP